MPADLAAAITDIVEPLLVLRYDPAASAPDTLAAMTAAAAAHGGEAAAAAEEITDRFDRLRAKQGEQYATNDIANAIGPMIGALIGQPPAAPHDHAAEAEIGRLVSRRAEAESQLEAALDAGDVAAVRNLRDELKIALPAKLRRAEQRSQTVNNDTAAVFAERAAEVAKHVEVRVDAADVEVALLRERLSDAERSAVVARRLSEIVTSHARRLRPRDPNYVPYVPSPPTSPPVVGLVVRGVTGTGPEHIPDDPTRQDGRPAVYRGSGAFRVEMGSDLDTQLGDDADA